MSTPHIRVSALRTRFRVRDESRVLEISGDIISKVSHRPIDNRGSWVFSVTPNYALTSGITHFISVN